MSEGAEEQRSDAGPRALVRACESLGAGFVDTLYSRIASALNESVAALTDKICGDMEENRLLEELRLVLLHKDQIGDTFRTGFVRVYQESLTSEQNATRAYLSAETSTQNSFSLVDDSQLEAWLAIDNLVAKIHDHCSDDLALLKERFNHLLPEARINKYRLPLGPDKFCHAFHDALEPFDVNIKTQIHCCGLLDAALSNEIGAFYAKVNQFLAGKGVLPTLKPPPRTEETARRRPNSAHYRADSDSRPGPDAAYDSDAAYAPDVSHTGAGAARRRGAGPAAASAATPLQEQMFEAIQTLLRAHFAQAVTTDGSVPLEFADDAGTPTALPVTPMLIDTLSALQRDDSVVERAGELIRGGLRHYVHGRFSAVESSAKGGRINQIDDETIEVISLIFDYILDDHSLSDFMKALIGRLQIPILKVAIVDRGFFSRKGHPARQLLNELAQAGAGWRDENEAAKDRLYEKMEAIVRRILNEFESDITIFEVLLSDLQEFLKDESRRFDEAQAQLLEAAKEAERAERAKSKVVQEIAARLIGHEIPEDMRDFLVVPWRQFITVLMLEEGEESATRGRALQLIDDLVWSLEPKKSAEERKRLTLMLPTMLETLRAGLERIEYDRNAIEDFISSLERHHFVSLKTGARAERQAAASATRLEQSEAKDAEVSLPDESEADRIIAEVSGDLDALASIDWNDMTRFDDVIDPRRLEGGGDFEKMIAEMGMEPEHDDGPRIDDEFTDLVRKLEIGAWVELVGNDGRDTRVKLAWKGDEYSNFSFVNRQFKVVAERPLYVLAAEFRRGAALVIDNVALFDRAVDGVIAGVMKLARSSGR